MIRKIKPFIGFIVLTVFSSASAYAGTLTFNQDDEYEYFDCNVEGYSKSDTVNFDTRSIDVMGFCRGDSTYVTSPGHVSHFPVNELKTYYFQVKKVEANSLEQLQTHHKYTDGRIDYSITNGNIICYKQSSAISNKTLYGQGKAFC